MTRATDDAARIDSLIKDRDEALAALKSLASNDMFERVKAIESAMNKTLHNLEAVRALNVKLAAKVKELTDTASNCCSCCQCGSKFPHSCCCGGGPLILE